MEVNVVADAQTLQVQTETRLALAHPRQPHVPPLRRPLRPHRTRRL